MYCNLCSVQRGPFTRAPLLPSPHLFETWQGAEPSRSAVKRRQRRRQRRRNPGSCPPRPQLPSDAAEPAEKVCKLPAGAARTPGHLGGGRAGGRAGLALARVRTQLLPPRSPGCRHCWWARAREGTSPLEGT